MEEVVNPVVQLLPRGQWVPLAEITPGSLIAAFIHLGLIIAVIAFFFTIMIAGIKVIFSGGDRDRLDNARRQFVNAFFGLFVVFGAWALMNFAGQFFGVDLMTFEIPQVS
jgi:hypothetical protein